MSSNYVHVEQEPKGKYEAFLKLSSLMVTEQGDWPPTLASGLAGGWVESAPVPQVEEEGEGADHPRESEDKVLHQSLGCSMYGRARA